MCVAKRRMCSLNRARCSESWYTHHRFHLFCRAPVSMGSSLMTNSITGAELFPIATMSPTLNFGFGVTDFHSFVEVDCSAACAGEEGSPLALA